MNFNPYKLYNCLSNKHSSLGEKFIFVYLTRHLVPDLIMDIGSRDGSDALNFKQFNPNAEVIAIEANPTLFEKMSDNKQLSEHGVKIFNLAATNTNGTATFSIFNEKKGKGSLRKRANGQFRKYYLFAQRNLRKAEFLLLSYGKENVFPYRT
jgi:hypothetical protein